MKANFFYKSFYRKIGVLSASIGIFLIPIFISAQSPLVPCTGPDCKLCHLFVMFNNIVGFVLYTIVPPIAVLMLVAGGILFYFSVGDPKKTETAKSLISSTIMGVLIIYFAWSIVILVFTALGAAQWDSWWYTITC